MSLMRTLFPFRQLAVAASLLALCGLAFSQATQIPAQPTTLVSTADRMISYRMQNHMWQTADGATHVIINRGPGRQGRSLVMYSTFDGGATWVDSGVSLPGSNGSTTSDGYLDGDTLFMAYDVGTGVIRAARLQYDPATQAWSLAGTETVYEATTAAALTPALAADGLGRRWLAFTHQDKATGNFSIKLMRQPAAGGAWVDTGFVFGPVDNLSNERSGRPVRTSRGIGMVFQVKAETFWAERSDQWPLDAKWPRAPIYTKTTPSNDPYGTHFSVVADADYNLHLASVDGGQVVYSRYLVADRVWTTRVLTDNIKASYLQATMVDGQLMIVTNSYTNLSVYQSTDGGTTFSRTHALTHPAPVDPIDYNRPRLETPAYSTSPVPVLQQYVDGKKQRAMFFAVPVVTAPAAAR